MSKFFVVEGIAGSGKTTLCNFLSEQLTALGVKHWITSEPARAIDDFIEYRKRHADEIESALSRGEIVICERYTWPTIVYQNIPADQYPIIGEGIPVPDAIMLMPTRPLTVCRRIFMHGESDGLCVNDIIELHKKYEGLARCESVKMGGGIHADNSLLKKTLITDCVEKFFCEIVKSSSQDLNPIVYSRLIDETKSMIFNEYLKMLAVMERSLLNKRCVHKATGRKYRNVVFSGKHKRRDDGVWVWFVSYEDYNGDVYSREADDFMENFTIVHGA